MRNRAILAFDIGGSKLMAGAVSATGEVLYDEKVPLLPDMAPEKLTEMLFEHGASVLEKAGNDVEFEAVGATIPGLADFRRGMWVYACFSGISDFPIADVLEKKFRLPAFVENDVNACAWAEKLFGNCKETDDYLWVTVSNGVGGGLVLSGELYTGAFLNAGEFGHLCVCEGGALCPCGNHGCIEAMASGRAISRRYHELTQSDAGGGEIARRARAGEPAAKQVFEEAGSYLGLGLSMAANLLNLSKYVLGGGVMQSYDILERPIKEAFMRHVFRKANSGSEICVTGLGYNAGLLGAAAIAIKGLNEIDRVHLTRIR